MLKLLQGSNTYIPVKSQEATLVIFDGINKYISSNVVESGTGYSIFLDSETTKEYIPGRYSYQIIAGDEIEDEGVLKVKANLLYANDFGSFWKRALKAIDERLAGKAVNPAYDVTIDGKKISYYSLDDLLRLREFILGKIAEEEEEEGAGGPAKSDEHRIIYTWSMR